MGVKAVYDVKHRSQLWRLNRKIRSASAAENHNVQFSLPVFNLFRPAYLGAVCQNLNSFRISSGKYCCQFHVRIVLHCTFNSSSQVPISHNSNSDCHKDPPFICCPKNLLPADFFGCLQRKSRPANPPDFTDEFTATALLLPE